MGKIRIVLLFDEENEKQRQAGEFLKTQKRCKTALITELIHAWIFRQLDLFTDFTGGNEKKQQDEKLEREKKMQEAVLSIKKKYGKNAILKGFNFQEGATTKARNEQIGGHKA